MFVLNADEPLDWWPIRHALQYFPQGGVFVVCVSDGTGPAPARACPSVPCLGPCGFKGGGGGRRTIGI